MDCKFSIDHSIDSRALENELKNSDRLLNETDIFLFDIEMDGVDGMDLGKIVRSKKKNAIIIYITGYKDYAVEAFEIKAFNYIMKPVLYDRFVRVLKDALLKVDENKYKKEVEKYYVVDRKDSAKKLKYNEIFYFEKSLRKIKVVLRNQTLEFYGSFRELKEELDMSHFTQCHQSFIVNNRKIEYCKQQEVYIEELNEMLPVSKRSMKEVKSALANSLFSKRGT